MFTLILFIGAFQDT